MKAAEAGPEAKGSNAARFGESLVEAGWLAALLALPLLHNIHASHAFDPVKIGLLRGIVLSMLLGALLAGLGHGAAALRSQLRSLLALPLVVPVLLWLAASTVACVFSIAPRDSLWGSYARQQGLLTDLGFALFFLLILCFLRRKAQWQRLVRASLLSSLAVAVYALVQRFGLDPLPWEWGGRRVISSLGNATALSSYLLLSLFLTIGWLLDRSFADGVRRLRTPVAALGLILLALQAYALLRTESRGPLLGLLIGLGFMVLATLARRSWGRRVLVAALLPVILGSAGLIALTISDDSGALLRRLPGSERFMDRGRHSKNGRILIWEQAGRMLWSGPSFPGPEGAQAEGARPPSTTLRPWIGYGPDALETAFAPYRSASLERVLSGSVVNHMHGELLDRWVASGLLGMLCTLALFASALLGCLRWLGMLARPADWRRLGICLVAGSGTAFLLWKLGGFGVLLAIGPALVLLASVFLFLLTSGGRAESSSWSARELWVLSLGSGIVGHLFEAQLRVSYTADRLMLWTLLAALTLWGGRRVTREDPALSSSEASGSEVGVWTVLLGIVYAVLGFDFLIDTGQASGIAEALWIGLMQPVHTAHAAPITAIALLALSTTSLAVGLMALETDASTRFRDRLLPFLAGLLGFALFVALFTGQRLAGDVSSTLGLAFGQRLAGHATAQQLLTIGLCFLLACMLQRTRGPLLWLRHPGRTLLPAALLVLALLGNAWLARPLRADVLVEYADAQRRSKHAEVAIASLDEALRLWPGRDELYAIRGTTRLEYTRQLPGREREEPFRRALEDLERAQEMRPLEPRYGLNLARSYRLWALHGAEPGKRYVRLQEALRQSEKARQLNPGVAPPYLESGRTLALLGNLERAVAELRNAESLDPRERATQMLLVQALAAWAQADRIAGRPQPAAEHSREAIDTLQRLLDEVPLWTTRVGLLRELVKQQAELGQLEEAIAASRTLLELQPADVHAHEELARLYERVGNPESARHRRRAQELRVQGSGGSFEPQRDLESVFGSWFDEDEPGDGSDSAAGAN